LPTKLAICLLTILFLFCSAYNTVAQPDYKLEVSYTELASCNGMTLLRVFGTTPYQLGIYKISYEILNVYGIIKRYGNSGWFPWLYKNEIYWETWINPALNGDRYFILAELQCAPIVYNDKFVP